MALLEVFLQQRVVAWRELIIDESSHQVFGGPTVHRGSGLLRSPDDQVSHLELNRGGLWKPTIA
jgi:hypothetical protein